MMDICSGVWYGATEGSSCPRIQHLRNAICKVQRQKQRPTAARICKAVRQCIDSVSIDEVTEWLDAAVQSGDILLINNDGVISYRERRRNLQNLPPTLSSNYRPPPVTDIFRQPECAWNFPPQYESFREFMTQPVNRSFGWTFPQHVAYDPYVQFGDRMVEQYGGWLGSFATVEPQMTIGGDPVQRRSYQNVPEHHSINATTATNLRDSCDENRNERDCSYGDLQSASFATEPCVLAVSSHATSVQTSCGQTMDVEMTDSGINSSCEEHRAAEDSDILPPVSESTDVCDVSVMESSADVKGSRLTTEVSELRTDDTSRGSVTEVVSICGVI